VIPSDAMTFRADARQGTDESILKLRALPVQGVLLAVAGWLAWRPAETFPWSAVVVAASILGLVAWGWHRTRPAAGSAALSALGGIGVLLVSGLAGHDPAAAIAGVSLVAAMTVLIWLASREAPPESWPSLLALVLAGLSIWGVLQVTAGPEHTQAILRQLPETLRSAGSERLAAGRAFASQPLPSHLAVLLATAFPLLLVRVRWRWSAAPWIAGCALCVVGLALTRSPIGVGLALVACAALAAARGGRSLRLVVVILVLVLAVVIVARGDVLHLEPVSLRLDNWRTAVWVWSTSPAAGVGFGGFGQVAQAVPFAVGNRPRFAHSLPVEWLAELGPVGFLAILAGGFALWRLVRDLWPHRPGLAAAIAVVPAHNLVDFSIHGSGVALPWAVLVGWAFAFRRGTPSPEAALRGRPVATALAALALAATILHATSATVLEVAEFQPAPEEQFAGALEARRLAPWRAETLDTIAIAALETGDSEVIAEASAELEKGVWLRPYSASLADLRSRLALALGEAPTAAAEAWTARRANPESTRFQLRLDQLMSRLQDEGRDPAR